MEEELNRFIADLKNFRQENKKKNFWPEALRDRGKVLLKSVGISIGTLYNWKDKLEPKPKNEKPKLIEVSLKKDTSFRLDINKRDLVVGIDNLSLEDVLTILQGVL